MKTSTGITAVLITLLLAATAPAQEKRTAAQEELKGKNIVLVVARHSFNEREYSISRTIVERAGAQVRIASSALSEATGGNLKIKPDMLVNEIHAEDFDAIVFIGGLGATEYYEDPQVHKLAAQALNQGKIVAAICLAPCILAKAGLLKGRKATGFDSYCLRERGAVTTGKMVECDGRIITGNGPSAATEFAQTIVAALTER